MKYLDNKSAILIGAVSAALIWVINNYTPAGYSVWIAYIPLLALLARNLTGRQVGWMAGAFAFTILSSHWTRQNPLPTQIAFVNRILGVSSIAILAWSIIRQKRAEQALRESEERFRGLFEHTLDAVVLFERENVIAINDAACGMFGYEKEKCETLCRSDIVLPQDRKVLSCVPGEECFRGEMTFVRRDGSLFEGEASSFTLPGSGGSVRTGMAIRDITERKELERRKAEFLAMVTHDLKSPLTTILGYSELMQESLKKYDIGKSLLGMVEGIRSGAQKLTEMVENFLIVSRLEAGRMELHPAPVSLTGIMEEIKTGFLPAAEKKGISLEAEVSDPPAAFLDKKYIERAVANLLQNAVNYTPAGGKVVLRAEAGHRETGGRRSQGGFLAISVRDTGPGIAEEEKHRIFDLYYRSSKMAGIKGTGLGLAIVKAVAEAHDGRVDVQSEVGKGSTFSIFLPATMAEKKAA